jgi:WD40 repeat protein/mono/diheme cytochrome c family protein
MIRLPLFAIVLVVSVAAASTPTARAADPKPVSFERQILPIFQGSCGGCHQPGKLKGGLDLTTFVGAMAGGKNGAAIKPGDAEHSLLLAQISGEPPEMPNKGEPLTKAEIALIRQWIQEGAKNDGVAVASLASGAMPGPKPLDAPPVYHVPPVITSIAYSPDGSTLAVSGYNEVLLHSTARPGAPIARLVGGAPRIVSVAYSNDGRRLVVAGGAPAQFGNVQVWSVDDRKLAGNWKISGDTVLGARFNAAGDQIALGCTDKSARVIAVADGKELLRLDQHTDWCTGALFTADGKRILTASRDQAMKLSNLANGQFIDDVNNPVDAIVCFARHPKEDLVAYGGAMGAARIYKISDNQGRTAGRIDTNLVKDFERQPAAVHAIAWSPDGAQIAVASEKDAKVFDAKSGTRVATLQGHEGSIDAIAFSPNGRQIATGGFDGVVRLFDAKTGKITAAFVPVPLSSVAKTAPAPANQPKDVGFVRDVEPIFAKVGCNAGTCHGAAKGKEGFKLSLRGYDPDYDYEALINDAAGRRFDRIRPENSLLLLKPSGGAPHEGGKVLRPDSEYYAIIRQWIAEGAREQNLSARATSIEVQPEQIHLATPGQRQQIRVMAHYKDGSTRDVTGEAVISSNSVEVLEAKENTVTALRRGEAAVLVRYEGNYAARPVFIMGDRSGFAWEDVPEYNFIDRYTKAKWQEMKIRPSELCTDAEFIRRASLDLTGQPPTAERVKAFLADPTQSRAKREKLVEELLASDAFVEFWTNKWCDLLQANSQTLGKKSLWMFRGWVRDQIAANVPYDQFVRELLLAKGSSYRNPEVNYYRALQTPEKTQEKTTEDITQTFLGVRFNCNHCHDHPFERWTQKQYYDFASYFASLSFKKGQLPEEAIVYENPDGGTQLHPKTKSPVDPMVPYGSAEDFRKLPDRRRAMVDWMTSPNNPLFAKSIANRTWSYFFGMGIIDPVDDIRASNPPSNPALLDALTADFVASKFDLRHLMRTIATSRTYQLSVASNQWNADDKMNFSHAKPRRLSAEQLIDAVAVATGYRPQIKGMPAGTRAVEAPDGIVEGMDALSLFGRPKRTSACECERTSNFSLTHAINLVNGSTISEAVAQPKSKIAQLVTDIKDDKDLINALYLTTLCRPATEQEMTAVTLGEGPARVANAQDLAWALMNSPAFLYNR